MNSTNYFQSKVALVTGGASGIGLAVSEALNTAGAIVYAADIDTQGLEELANKVSSQGSKSNPIHTAQLNVSDLDAFQHTVNRVVNEQGQLDLMINNAGIVMGGAFAETSISSIQNIIDINLWSVIYGSKIAYEQMLKQGYGHIANVSSSAGMMPVPNSTVYSAIKHAILGLSHSLREEAEQHGIEVSTILPGMVKSNLWDNAENISNYDYKKTMQETGIKPISAEQAAQAILFGIERNHRSIIFPRLNKFIVRAYQLMPNLMTKLAVKPMAKP